MKDRQADELTKRSSGGNENMNTEQENNVIEALVNFVVRVAEGNVTNDAESSALPLVAETLLEFTRGW